MADREPEVHLILGGVRSGKSAFAEGLAHDLGLHTVYLATGQAMDEEMEERIRLHRQRRPNWWDTLEESLNLPECLQRYLASRSGPTAVIVESIDGWLANILLKHEDKPAGDVENLALCAADRLLDVGRKGAGAVFAVSAEVGLTLTPTTPLGRRFQDLLGLVNQRVAGSADRVTLVVAGLPVAIKT